MSTYRHRVTGGLALLAGALLLTGCAVTPAPDVGSWPGPDDASSPAVAAPGAPLTPSPAATARPSAVPADAAEPAAGGSDGVVLPDMAARPAPMSLPSLRPASTPVARPLATPAPAVQLDPPPSPGKFQMALFRPGIHVRQTTTSMCVAASMQMMINMIESGRPDTARETQQELYELARSWSPWLGDRGGASARGWGAGLNQLGYGEYQLVTLPTMDEAVRAAARQMRLTGKPVGLLVWAGRHAWVMSGFKATADPAYSDDFEVTAVWLEDPWYGRTDRNWGAGLEPHTLMKTDDLRQKFVSWRSRFHQAAGGPGTDSAGRFVIVAPLS